MTDSKKEPATPIPESLKGLTAIVTGGAKGIGLGIAKDLASQGCRIAIWDIDVTALAEATTELQQMGAEVFAQQVSVTSQDDVELAVTRLHNTTGRVDILVNNAGVQYPQEDLTDIDNEQLERNCVERTVDRIGE